MVGHDVRPDDALVGRRDGASVGYLLRKHRYPPRVLARMFVRPVGGIAKALVDRDLPRARYYLASVTRSDPRLRRSQALEELRMTVEPGLEGEALDRPLPRRRRVRR